MDDTTHINVVTTNESAFIGYRVASSTPAHVATLVGWKSRGSLATPSALQEDDEMLAIGVKGYGASAWAATHRAEMKAAAAENWTDAAQGTYWTVTTTPIGGNTPTVVWKFANAANYSAVPLGIGTDVTDRLLNLEHASLARIRCHNTGASAAHISFNSVRTGADQQVGAVYCDWDDTNIGLISFRSGADTVNKDEGEIAIFVNPGGGSALVEAVRIDKDGRVGIGVTPETAWLSTWTVLRVGDQTTIANIPDSGGYFLTNAYWGGSNWRYIETDHALSYSQYTGYHRWRTAVSGTAGTVVSFTEVMRLTNSGRLGIACTAPVEPVEVWTANSDAVLWAMGLRNPYDAATTEYGVGLKMRCDDASDSKWAGVACIAETNNANYTALAFYSDSFEYMRLGGERPVLFFNDIATTDATYGILINQQGQSDACMVFQQSDYVSHGMTDVVEDDTWGVVKIAQQTSGGLGIHGYKDAGGVAGRALYLLGALGETADTTKSTSAHGVIQISALVKSGTGFGNVGADGNLVVIKNNATTRYIFDAEGTGHADIAWTTFSDARLKRNIRPLEYGLNEVLSLGPVHFQRLDNERKLIGLLAQDVHDIVPEVTRKPSDAKSYWTLDTPGLVPVLVSAVQELSQLVYALADTEGNELSNEHLALLKTIRNNNRKGAEHGTTRHLH